MTSMKDLIKKLRRIALLIMALMLTKKGFANILVPTLLKFLNSALI